MPSGRLNTSAGFSRQSGAGWWSPTIATSSQPSAPNALGCPYRLGPVGGGVEPALDPAFPLRVAPFLTGLQCEYQDRAGGVTGPGITTKPARRPTVVVQMSRYAMSQDGRLSHCGSQLSHATRSPRRAAAITWLCCRREARRPRTRDPGAHPVASDPAGLYVGVRLLVALAVLGARLRWSRR